MSRVVASIEARMSSSRLPGKVLSDIEGLPALSRLLRRLKLCNRIDEIILATSINEADDALERWAKAEGLLCHRGSEDDVLQRVVDAQLVAKSDIVVEITGDCILTDPQIIDMTIHTFFENDVDVVSSISKRAFPMGVGAQVFRLNDLIHVSKTITDPSVHEHVSLYFYEHPELYRTIYLMPPQNWHEPTWRFQIDYPEDLKFTREIYRRLLPSHGDSFGIEEIMQVCRAEPHLPEINRHCAERPARMDV